MDEILWVLGFLIGSTTYLLALNISVKRLSLFPGPTLRPLENKALLSSLPTPLLMRHLKEDQESAYPVLSLVSHPCVGVNGEPKLGKDNRIQEL